METRFGYVAVIGPTNAGKSTLLNLMTGAPIASVSHKVQTTDRCIYGINTFKQSQIAFIDTPGFFVPKKRTSGQASLMRHITYGADESDLVLVVVDGQKPIDETFLSFIKDCMKCPAILCINKVDDVRNKEELLPLIAAYAQYDIFAKIFLISALKDKGLQDVLQDIGSRLPSGPWMYDKDSMTTLSGKELAAEVLRGAIFSRFNQELPYTTSVKVKKWTRSDDNEVHLEVDIFVLHESQKKVLVGEKGAGVSFVRKQSERRLGSILGVPVHALLRVLVKR